MNCQFRIIGSNVVSLWGIHCSSVWGVPFALMGFFFFWFLHVDKFGYFDLMKPFSTLRRRVCLLQDCKSVGSSNGEHGSRECLKERNWALVCVSFHLNYIHTLVSSIFLWMLDWFVSLIHNPVCLNRASDCRDFGKNKARHGKSQVWRFGSTP